jgi:opacity protein-like surface antigen
VSGSGRGMKGGVGGDANFGYVHEFDNNVILGVNTAVGYAPSVFRYSPYSGFDVATTNITVGYDMGRLTTFVTIGVALEKPRTSLGAGYTGAGDAVNGLFSGPADLRAAGSVGAGFNYAITNNLSVSGGVSVSRGPGLFPAIGPGPGL